MSNNKRWEVSAHGWKRQFGLLGDAKISADSHRLSRMDAQPTPGAEASGHQSRKGPLEKH